jgi:putative hemolysin
MATDTGLSLALLLALLGLHALLSATRAALMNAHAPTLRALSERGVRGAARSLGLASEASRLLLSFGAIQYLVRLGVLGCGLAAWYLATAEPRSLWTFAAALAVLGAAAAAARQLGESLAVRNPEKVSCVLSPLASAVVLAARPFVALHGSLAGHPVGRRSGVVPPVVTEEEIKTLVDAGEEGGAIEVVEKNMILSIFELGDTLAREVMVPRIDIQAFEEGQGIEEVADALLESGHSRGPVFREDIDKIIGVVYVKDLLKAFRQGQQHERVGAFLRPALFVPEAKKADDLLAELQTRRVHLAVVVDEYGGTAGIVTLEDLVEEIVGEIRDEYDAAEEAAYQRVQEGEFIFSGRIDLDDVNELTGAELSKETSETLGGFIAGILGRVPVSGDSVDAGGLHLVVEQVGGRRILKVRANRESSNGEEAPDS